MAVELLLGDEAVAHGALDAGFGPVVAVIGDSTFTHSGLTPLLDAAYDNTPMTVLLLDNGTTAMTGGQDSPGLGKYEQICVGLGIMPEHVRTVVPLPKNHDQIVKVLREEVEYEGVLKDTIRERFEAKGDKVVSVNLKAFDAGRSKA